MGETGPALQCIVTVRAKKSRRKGKYCPVVKNYINIKKKRKW